MVGRNFRLRRNRNRGSWFFCFPTRGKSFDVSKQILPIVTAQRQPGRHVTAAQSTLHGADYVRVERQGSSGRGAAFELGERDRKSTRLNSSHLVISYAVFCLKKKKNKHQTACP